MVPTPSGAAPVPRFTHDPSVAAFLLSPPDFIAKHFAAPGLATGNRSPAPRHLATGAIVFDRPFPPSSSAAADCGPTPDANANAGTLQIGAAMPPPPSPPPPRVLLLQRAPTDTMPLRWETPGGGCDADDASVLSACARELAEEAGLTAVSVGPVVRCPTVSRRTRTTRATTTGEAATAAAAAQQRQSQQRTTATSGQDEAAEVDAAEWGERMGGQFFLTRRGTLICKFTFVVSAGDEVEDKIALDPIEHVRFLWATEAEIRARRMAPRSAEDGEGEALAFTTREQWETLLEAFKLWK